MFVAEDYVMADGAHLKDLRLDVINFKLGTSNGDTSLGTTSKNSFKTKLHLDVGTNTTNEILQY